MKLLLILVLILVLLVPASPSIALTEGAQLFQIHCAGCHPQGGNIIRRGKNLKAKALEKYGMNNREAIAAIITTGKNNMSGYGEQLSSEQINTLADYVLNQSQLNWSSYP